MGKGQIVAHLGEGRYSVKLLHERTKADQALLRIDNWIALNQSRQDALPYGDPEHKLPGLKLSMAALLKQKEYLLRIPADPTVSAWCADLTETLSGDVGTIEINGDPDESVNIRPGYLGGAAHNPARDGQAMNIMAMTPEQAFYNMAMMPGWQKWMPTYRLGTITGISGDTCTVRIDDASSSLSSNGTGELNINQAWDLADVDIDYMDCHGLAFAEGDRVIVQFVNQDFDAPQVIGFENNPKPCGTDLYFYIVRRESGLYFIERYITQILNESGTTAATLDGTATLPDIGVYAGQRMSLVDAAANMNQIEVWCKSAYFRGVAWDPGSFPTGMYTNLRLPITAFNETDYDPFEMSGLFDAHVAKEHHLSPGGARYGVATIYDNSDVNLFSALTMQLSGVNLNVAEGLFWDGTHHPLAYIENYIDMGCVTPCIVENRLLLGIRCNLTQVAIDAEFEFPYNPAFLGYYIGEWTGEQSGTNQWYYGTTPFLSTMTRKFLTLTQQQFNSLHQIVHYDGRIYVFFNFDQGEYVKGVWMDVYDSAAAAFLSRRTFPEGWHFSRVSVLNYKGLPYLCLSTIDTWDTGDSSAIHLIDIDTLDTRYQISLPFDYFDENFVAANKPSTDRMVDHHNRIRHEWSVANATDYASRVFYLGRSMVCTAIAQEHLNWLLANGRIQHEDENGDPVGVRSAKYGLFFVGENIAQRMPSVSVNDDIDYSVSPITGWPSSPHHYANMTNRMYNQMGWASGIFPPSVTSYISGPGQYIPETGGYTTEESYVDIPLEYRGTLRVFVVVFAAG